MQERLEGFEVSEEGKICSTFQNSQSPPQVKLFNSIWPDHLIPN